MWKIAKMIVLSNIKNAVSSNILSSEEEGQCPRPPIAALATLEARGEATSIFL